MIFGVGDVIMLPNSPSPTLLHCHILSTFPLLFEVGNVITSPHSPWQWALTIIIICILPAHFATTIILNCKSFFFQIVDKSACCSCHARHNNYYYTVRLTQLSGHNNRCATRTRPYLEVTCLKYWVAVPIKAGTGKHYNMYSDHLSYNHN